MTKDHFCPCRIIRGYGSPSLGIFGIPCDTVEGALVRGFDTAEDCRDFEENYTVVRILDEPVGGRDYELVPEDVIAFLKKGVMS